ncbi:hypothetical protein HGRIS_003881 [Hohenbuehelia grisea]|uniref:Uncharacterized protein n=1 Tax=Hohenbuehelia grisea TaxID=104357 RepID=A0ABR3JGT2_9AGAR
MRIIGRLTCRNRLTLSHAATLLRKTFRDICTGSAEFIPQKMLACSVNSSESESKTQLMTIKIVYRHASSVPPRLTQAAAGSGVRDHWHPDLTAMGLYPDFGSTRYSLQKASVTFLTSETY